MPYADSKRRRDYARDFMRKKRARAEKHSHSPQAPDVKPSPSDVKPSQAETDPSKFIDWTRPYTVNDRFPWPAYLMQDGRWYRPDNGELIGTAH
jgi:hypothetical protein